MTLPEIAEAVTRAVDGKRKARILEIRRDEKDFFDQLRKIKLKEAQIEGVEWLSATYDLGLHCILGDGMGAGKTAQAIFFLFRLRAKGIPGPFLITVPSNVLEGWIKELKQWSDAWFSATGIDGSFSIYK